MEMLRDKIKGLERQIVEMVRHGQDNVAIADKLDSPRALSLIETVHSTMVGMLMQRSLAESDPEPKIDFPSNLY